MKSSIHRNGGIQCNSNKTEDVHRSQGNFMTVGGHVKIPELIIKGSHRHPEGLVSISAEYPVSAIFRKQEFGEKPLCEQYNA